VKVSFKNFNAPFAINIFCKKSDPISYHIKAKAHKKDTASIPLIDRQIK
jgi:hypothetical protein